MRGDPRLVSVTRAGFFVAREVTDPMSNRSTIDCIKRYEFGSMGKLGFLKGEGERREEKNEVRKATK